MLVHSIFQSISGEVAHCPQGTLVTFVRFAGCNLRPSCGYICDAPDAQDPIGTEISNKELIEKINEFDNKDIILTGGEPLLQNEKDLFELCWQLTRNGYSISIETNGSIDITCPLMSFVKSFVVDYKLKKPSKMIIRNYYKLRSTDFIKFVVEDQRQFTTAKSIHQVFIEDRVAAKVFYSPMIPDLKTITAENLNKVRELTQYMFNNLKGIEAGINLQLHKILNLE